jgi:hypothetical protein
MKRAILTPRLSFLDRNLTRKISFLTLPALLGTRVVVSGGKLSFNCDWM